MARDRFGYGTDRSVEEEEMRGLKGADSMMTTNVATGGGFEQLGAGDESWLDPQAIDEGLHQVLGFIPQMPDPSHYKTYKSYAADLGRYGELSHGMLSSKVHKDKNFRGNQLDAETIQKIAKRNWSTSSSIGTNLKGGGSEELAYAVKRLGDPKYGMRQLPQNSYDEVVAKKSEPVKFQEERPPIRRDR